MPRPTKLTVGTEALLVTGVRAGLTVGIACEVAGITPRTYQRWMASPRPEHRQLREAVQRSRAGCEQLAGRSLALGAAARRALGAPVDRRP
jgi:hypothetical protein